MLILVLLARLRARAFVDARNPIELASTYRAVFYLAWALYNSVILFGFALTRLGGDFFAASLIERFGERTITVTGAAVVGVSSLAAGAAQTYWQLVVLRGMGGFGSALFSEPSPVTSLRKLLTLTD